MPKGYPNATFQSYSGTSVPAIEEGGGRLRLTAPEEKDVVE